jgi:hypothetical protein
MENDGNYGYLIIDAYFGKHVYPEPWETAKLEAMNDPFAYEKSCKYWMSHAYVAPPKVYDIKYQVPCPEYYRK